MLECCKKLTCIPGILQAICKEENEELEREIFSCKFKILMTIYARKIVSPKELVKNLQIAKSNLAMFCKSLIKDGKIVDKKDPKDRRIIYYTLTKSGENFITDKLKILEEIFLSQLSVEETKVLKESVDNIFLILNNMGGERNA